MFKNEQRQKNLDKPDVWTVNSTVNYYREYFKREPPINFEFWVDYSLKNKCILDPSFYAKIDKQVSKFRDP